MRIAQCIILFGMLSMLNTPHLSGQEFLKQLEQKLFQKQQEKQQDAKNTEGKSKDPSSEPLRFPSVLEPTTNEEELPPKANKDAASEAPALLTPPPKPADQIPAARPSPFPSRPRSTPAATVPGGGGYLGLTVDAIPGSGFGLSVTDVTPDSPAWKAGFRTGDRIIGVSGQAVATIDAFAEQLQKFTPGSPVKFLVDRRGRQATLVAVLQDRAVAGKVQGNVAGTAVELSPPEIASSGRAFFGVNVSDMSDGFRKQFAIPAYRGASVTSVIPRSPAEAAGLRPGDCIVELDGRTVQSATQVLDAVLRAKPGQVLSVSYYRGRQLIAASIALTVDQAPSNSYVPLGPSSPDITPEMLTPEYVASLQSELERVNNELNVALQKMQQLEARIQSLERPR